MLQFQLVQVVWCFFTSITNYTQSFWQHWRQSSHILDWCFNAPEKVKRCHQLLVLLNKSYLICSKLKSIILIRTLLVQQHIHISNRIKMHTIAQRMNFILISVTCLCSFCCFCCCRLKRLCILGMFLSVDVTIRLIFKKQKNEQIINMSNFVDIFHEP